LANALGSRGPPLVAPLQLLERIAALVPPPRVYRQRHFGVLARTAADRKFPRQPRTAGVGRSATVEAERERFDRRRSQYDPKRTFSLGT
jgi:hypothetical protein